MELTTDLAEHSFLSTYKRLRHAAYRLNNILTEQLPKPALMAGAKKLGLRSGKFMVFDDPDEISLLLDYCLYNFRRRGRTLIEEYLDNGVFPEESDETLLLKAMAESHYSVFIVEKTYPGTALSLYDTFLDSTLFLIDIGLSSTAKPRHFFAGRVLPMPGFWMTSGAFLVLGPDTVKQEVLPTLDKHLENTWPAGEVTFTPSQEASFSARVIRSALREGCMEHMGYQYCQE
jgi:hypothetical protein